MGIDGVGSFPTAGVRCDDSEESDWPAATMRSKQFRSRWMRKAWPAETPSSRRPTGAEIPDRIYQLCEAEPVDRLKWYSYAHEGKKIPY